MSTPPFIPVSTSPVEGLYFSYCGGATYDNEDLSSEAAYVTKSGRASPYTEVQVVNSWDASSSSRKNVYCHIVENSPLPHLCRTRIIQIVEALSEVYINPLSRYPITFKEIDKINEALYLMRDDFAIDGENNVSN